MPSFKYDMSTTGMVTMLTVVLVGLTWLGAIFVRPLMKKRATSSATTTAVNT